MSVMIGSARHDERGGYTNGDINVVDPSEVSTQKFYQHSKGWYVLRAKDVTKRGMIADCCQWACDSPYGNYDQNNRDYLYLKAKPFGFDVRMVKQNWETDCSALVRVCCNYAGITVGDFYTGNEKAVLLATGAFEEVPFKTEADLRRGDILVTKTKGHTAIVTQDDQPKLYTPGTWYCDEGSLWWFATSESTYAKNEWLKINGHWYYFDSRGYAMTGLKVIDGKRYYFETEGDLACALMKTDENGALIVWEV